MPPSLFFSCPTDQLAVQQPALDPFNKYVPPFALVDGGGGPDATTVLWPLLPNSEGVFDIPEGAHRCHGKYILSDSRCTLSFLIAKTFGFIRTSCCTWLAHA